MSPKISFSLFMIEKPSLVDMCGSCFELVSWKVYDLKEKKGPSALHFPSQNIMDMVRVDYWVITDVTKTGFLWFEKG